MNGSTMNNPLAPRSLHRFEGHRRFAAENLKRCPLCGAVNARQNDECFLCAWSGQFEYDIEAVEEGLEELLERCPELAELLIEPAKPIDRLVGFFGNLWHRLFRRRIDFVV